MITVNDFNFKYDRNTAVALGTFDGVHLGHMAVIKTAVGTARAEGLVPAVFTFSGLPKNAFLPESRRVWPLCSFEEKRRLIESLGVELLLAPPFDETVSSIPAEEFVRGVLISKLCARHIVCGFDHRFGAGGCGDAELLYRICKSEGVAVTVIPPVTVNGRRVSSTEIRRLLGMGRVEDARALLGHEI